ncbi:MAG: delta-60 repeat domain-containing protein, partial [Deltaproteobacteria bacterium]|nr:delta-60 repeat domain-containing protein [Deltaproteobacteria bacterium]
MVSKTLSAVGFVAFLIFISPSNSQAHPNSPDRESSWVTNGPVYAMTTDRVKNLTYIGGSFTRLGPYQGSGLPISASSALPAGASNFPKVNGTVRAVIPDGNDGWYIGGFFTKVGSFNRNRLAHILSDGSLDPAWDPDVDGPVFVLTMNGSVLYVGGSFSSIDGASRNNLAAINANSARVNAWNPNVTYGAASAFVNTLAMNSLGSTIYVGGSFSVIGNAQTRSNLAAIDTNTGVATNWNPSPNGPVTALAVSPNDATLFVGGSFSALGQGGNLQT